MKQTRKGKEGQQKDHPGQAIESGEPQITGKPKGGSESQDKQKQNSVGNRPKDTPTEAPESGRTDALPN